MVGERPLQIDGKIACEELAASLEIHRHYARTHALFVEHDPWSSRVNGEVGPRHFGQLAPFASVEVENVEAGFDLARRPAVREEDAVSDRVLVIVGSFESSRG